MTMKYDKFIFISFLVLLAGNSLNAYNIGRIPIQWIANLGFVGLVLHMLLTNKLYFVPGTKVIFVFFAWGLVITILNMVFRDYAIIMPSNSTTPYYLFISLRFLTYACFIAAVYCAYGILVSQGSAALIKWIVIIGTVSAILAIYILIAQIFNLFEIPRSRIEVIGLKQNVGIFTCLNFRYYRAMGTFIEPSILADWLMAPFFLSMRSGKRILNASSFLIGMALFLTFSLSGILSVLIGIGGAVFLSIFSSKMSIYKVVTFIKAVLFVTICYFIIDLVYSSLSGMKFTSIGDMLRDRISPILRGGIKGSNRYYIYEYIAANAMPFFGYGVGNANILLSNGLGIPIMASFLSLYLNTLFSMGIVGVALLIIFISWPLFEFYRIRKFRNYGQLFLLLGCHFSYIFAFMVNQEELTITFAIIYALLIYEIKTIKNGARDSGVVREGGSIVGI
jgi:hypothetical protein